MDTTDGFEPIIAMFYSVFHPTEGTKVIHQVPSGVIVPPSNDDNRLNNNIPDSSALDEPLFDFDTIKNYVIPKPSLCNKLITLKIDKYRILGFPVNIYAPQYARNSFGFNFCFVFSYESDTTPYEGNIKRIGKMFRALEEQSQLLSKSLKDSHVYYQLNTSTNIHTNQNMPTKFNMTNKYLRIIDDWDEASHQIVLDKKAPGLDIGPQQKISSIESLIQQIFQDLNNYSECMIPIDASNSVDLKLFPISPPPPQVHSHDVPIALVKLYLLIDSLWDPTMLKIMPFINGINSIAQISELSDANLDLTKECIRHLLHYKSIALLDIFQFQNHYTITSLIGNFLRDPDMANACQDYVLNVKGTFSDIPLKSTTRRQSNTNSISSNMNELYGLSASYSSAKNARKPELLTMDSSSSNPFGSQKKQQIRKLTLPSKATLFQLYNSLNSNMSVSQWYMENAKLLEFIDVRKFITFGTRNGIITRIHWYPVCGKLDTSLDSGTTDTEKKKTNFNVLSLPVPSDERLVRSQETKINEDRKEDDDEEEAEADEDIEAEDVDDEKEDDDYDVEVDGLGVKGSTDAGRREDEDFFDDSNDHKHKRIEKREKLQEKKLLRLMKHTQHMDAICTTMRLSKNEVMKILERIGDIEVIER
ncbi:hypothetical protein PMKS-000427 [Pichia membranifaciens]|uniref:Nitrogen permease regulator 2 n=1 Tax=Pichia membranifaciens TaxID=4926 RepID=A0A1Q2YBN2_9ASCO|nr:hypothetical protein PMKS-000427 [Pichia membranifaciens]